jgi:hypothetical protein
VAGCIGTVLILATAAPAATAADFFQYVATVGLRHTAASASVIFAVPAGRRLVVENLSGLGYSTGIQDVHVSQSTGITAVLPVRVLSGSAKWSGTTPTKVRLNEGNVFVTVGPAAPSGSCDSCTSANYITITGYVLP